MRKRVCIVRKKFYPEQRNMRRSAETLQKAGYEVDVICAGLKGQSRSEILNGVNIRRIFYSYHRKNILWYLYEYTAFFILAFLRLTWLSLRKRYDVIEVQTMPDFLVFVTLIPRLMGSRVILYMFENIPLLFGSSYGFSPNHISIRILRFVEKISAGYAHHVIVSDGPLHKEEVENCGIRSDKITVVLNVPDDSVFNLQPGYIADNGNSFNLVIVSSILKRYGIQTVINAVPLLVKDIPELKIDIVGSGDYRRSLEKMAQDLEIQKYLNFTGYISYEEVPDYIKKAHIGVAPMIDDVGAPNKIFEYSALSKATIASDLPGLKVIFDDSSVLYYQPGNEKELATKILELYRNPEKRTSLGCSAQEIYLRYHWPLMKQEYMKVYQRLLG